MWIFSRDSKSKKTQTVYDTIRKHRISMSEKIVQINLYIELILIQNAIDSLISNTRFSIRDKDISLKLTHPDDIARK